MQLKFEDADLERLAYDFDARTARWSPEVTRAYRRVVFLLENAQDERDVRSFKGLRLEKLKGTRAGTSSLRINTQYRLIVRFGASPDGRIAVIIEAVDYH
jgi:proteic killer suppression protein